MDFFTKPILLKFLKFGVVGASGVLVDFGITYLFKEIFKIPKFISNAIGFCVAASSNYLLNRVWTFESHNPNVGFEYLRFFLVSLIGLAINTLILWLLHQKLKWNFWFSKLCAIAVVTVWNFIMNLLFTFNG